MLTDAESLKQSFPLLNELCILQPVTWFNPRYTSMQEGYPQVGLSAEQVADAAALALKE